MRWGESEKEEYRKGGEGGGEEGDKEREKWEVKEDG